MQRVRERCVYERERRGQERERDVRGKQEGEGGTYAGPSGYYSKVSGPQNAIPVKPVEHTLGSRFSKEGCETHSLL